MMQEIVRAGRNVLAKYPNPTFPQAMVASACLFVVAEAARAVSSVLVAGINNGWMPDLDFKNLRFHFVQQAAPAA